MSRQSLDVKPEAESMTEEKRADREFRGRVIRPNALHNSSSCC